MGGEGGKLTPMPLTASHSRGILPVVVAQAQSLTLTGRQAWALCHLGSFMPLPSSQLTSWHSRRGRLRAKALALACSRPALNASSTRQFPTQYTESPPCEGTSPDSLNLPNPALVHSEWQCAVGTPRAGHTVNPWPRHYALGAHANPLSLQRWPVLNHAEIGHSC